MLIVMNTSASLCATNQRAAASPRVHMQSEFEQREKKAIIVLNALKHTKPPVLNFHFVTDDAFLLSSDLFGCQALAAQPDADTGLPEDHTVLVGATQLSEAARLHPAAPVQPTLRVLQLDCTVSFRRTFLQNNVYSSKIEY